MDGWQVAIVRNLFFTIVGGISMVVWFLEWQGLWPSVSAFFLPGPVLGFVFFLGFAVWFLYGMVLVIRLKGKRATYQSEEA